MDPTLLLLGAAVQLVLAVALAPSPVSRTAMSRGKLVLTLLLVVGLTLIAAVFTVLRDGPEEGAGVFVLFLTVGIATLGFGVVLRYSGRIPAFSFVSLAFLAGASVAIDLALPLDVLRTLLDDLPLVILPPLLLVVLLAVAWRKPALNARWQSALYVLGLAATAWVGFVPAFLLLLRGVESGGMELFLAGAAAGSVVVTLGIMMGILSDLSAKGDLSRNPDATKGGWLPLRVLLPSRLDERAPPLAVIALAFLAPFPAAILVRLGQIDPYLAMTLVGALVPPLIALYELRRSPPATFTAVSR